MNRYCQISALILKEMVQGTNNSSTGICNEMCALLLAELKGGGLELQDSFSCFIVKKKNSSRHTVGFAVEGGHVISEKKQKLL